MVLPIYWYLLVHSGHQILYVFDGALAARVVVDELILVHQECGCGLSHVHFLV